MNCRDLEAEMQSRPSGSPLPPAAAEHLAECERCRRLLQVWDAAPQLSTPSRERVHSIQAAMLQQLKPVRLLPPPSVLLAGFAAGFLLVAAAGFLLVDPYGWETLSLMQKSVVFVSLACGAAILAISLVRQMRPGSRYTLPPALLPAVVLLLLVAAMSAVFRPEQESDFTSDGLVCLRIGLQFAIPGALLSWLWLRRGAALSPQIAGATAGAFAALIGIMVLAVHCPNLDLNHVLLWHLGVLVVCASAGFGLGTAAGALGRRGSF